jgi:ABC-type antimicrobial peptide transport system permease subunit
MKPTNLLAMALEGLSRKKSRNALTMLGIVIAILSLTLVISAGEGMNGFIDKELKQEHNMLQVAVHPGFGVDSGDIFAAVEVEGEMDDAKRNRIRRAIINRTGPQHRAGRKTKIITDEVIEEFGRMDHVTAVQPLMHERYDVRCGGRDAKAVMSLAIAHDNERYAKRLIAGRQFSSPDAREIIVHEHLLYSWKVYSDAEQAQWVGKEIEIESLGGGGILDSIQAFARSQGLAADPEAMLEARGIELSDEEKKAVQGLAVKFITGMMNTRTEVADSRAHRFEIVGVIRDFEPEDGNFHLLEDGAALVADVFLPIEVSRSIFLESAFNRDQGYNRVIVVADSSENAKVIQKELQKKGYIAVSMGALLEEMDSVLMGLTIFQSFITSVILIVAGLGIMTTMITSVLERTREIGIWKAVGATNCQVLLVFLTESAILGFVGSIIGLVGAWLLMIPGNVIGRYILHQKTTLLFSGDVFVLPVWVIVVAPIFATIIGVAASIYPAMRAARIDPVRALRHD